MKRASPSKGPIRPDLEVGSIVKAYEAAGARAVSVLTEQDHFGGSLDDLRAAAASTGLPLLRKDFIVDAYQVHEARVFGASAVLLIAALLDDAELLDLAGLANHLGLDVLLEVHDATEMTRALAVDGAIIGVNNRDLRTFAVSLETTERLAGSGPSGEVVGRREWDPRPRGCREARVVWSRCACWLGRVSCGMPMWGRPSRL